MIKTEVGVVQILGDPVDFQLAEMHADVRVVACHLHASVRCELLVVLTLVSTES